MPKTPDEIKKGLECCNYDCLMPCAPCPYHEVYRCATAVRSDALALIQQLEAQVPRWISVEERLPERGVEVLGTNGKEVEMCTYWPGQPTPWESWKEFHFKPTHWMPLPVPPEESP